MVAPVATPVLVPAQKPLLLMLAAVLDVLEVDPLAIEDVLAARVQTHFDCRRVVYCW